MDTDYDRKFEEMKKYIPFLESMIKKLESTSGGPGSKNPRQAQLDKIRSLRDLLLDKKKRMKMENLLKCEQVLVNLYAKVEQRDTLPGIRQVSEVFPPSSPNSGSDLLAVRNKLKTVTLKQKIKEEETLPEIARRSEMEESCTPGSKEPALFQRRPNKALSPSLLSSAQTTENMSLQMSGSKRNYTRVLVSPEPNPQRWSIGDENTAQKPLFSRRSPRRSPKRHSPSYKKEKRKSFNQSRHTKDLNITLNVPQDSLDSLNTDDILSRIINCDDNDVDIASLRDLRTQILGELKQTGASEDISDIIMKSYKTKKKKKVRNVKKRDEIEEGELSDSESEAIESIYGSLVVVDKDKANSGPSGTKDSIDKEIQSRKIQICLVINSDKDDKGHQVPKTTDVSDFEMFDDVDIAKPTEEDKEKEIIKQARKVDDIQHKMERLNSSPKEDLSKHVFVTIDDDDESKKIVASQINPGNLENNNEAVKDCKKDSGSSFIDLSDNSEAEKSLDKTKERSKTPMIKANFYKPLHDNEVIESSKNTPEISDATQLTNKGSSLKSESVIDKKTLELPTVSSDDKSNVEKEEDDSSSCAKSVLPSKVDDPKLEELPKNVEIPLLNTEPVVAAAPVKNVLSEIDILQALKNEILSESIAIPGAEGSTPLLHQPKVTKVANTQEIINKKRISIEKYKQKSNCTTTSSLFMNESFSTLRYYEYGKKQSLKLTEEECERFNFPKKMALDDSSDEEDKNDYSADDIYGDLAPKSPENDDVSTVGSSTPIIIPVDPIKSSVVNSKIDVDMRAVMPILSPNSGKPLPAPPPVPLMSIQLPAIVPSLVETKLEQNKRPLLVDPRIRRDFNKHMSKESPNPYTSNAERSRPPNYANLTPNRTPCMTPNARTYEMTPSHPSFDSEDNSNRKHVYAPLPQFDSRERESDAREISGPVWETNIDSVNEGRKTLWEDREDRDGNTLRSYWEEHERKSDRWDTSDRRGSLTRDLDYQKSRHDISDRYQHSKSDKYSNDQRDDYYNRQECPRTPSHPFGRMDCPTTPNPSFGRLEAPITPIHPFGRSDCPTTPSHPFGRLDRPQTPSHAFGRSECPLTPSHPFGRTDAPLTPSHHFGRSDCPMTPSHPFGRPECPMTPSHPFGRNDRNMAPMTPSHPFGRSDYHQNPPVQKFKDPRLNRSTEYDSQRRDDDKDRDYYRDRKRSDHSNRSHNVSSSYYNYSREQSVSRNDRDKNYEQKRQTRERTPHRESSDGRGYPKDSERCYSRRETDTGRVSDSSHENIDDSKLYYQRASSVGRTHPSDDRYHRSSSRALNIHKNCHDSNNDNTLSVKPQSGRSFVIDTSVNRTFQEFLNEKGLHLQIFDPSFASRRQRAASVGRSLTRESSIERTRRESSVGRELPKPAAACNDSLDYKRMVNFVRARSMSRDFGDKKPQKTLKEIKADFQSYNSSCNKKEYNKKCDQKRSSQTVRIGKDLHQMQDVKRHQQSNTKTTYSPRKNQRDPRMKRDQYHDHKNRNRHEGKKNTYGIVYSSDNIAKGTILGSGYGVGNYKIPKIKRPVEEVTKEDSKIIEQHKKPIVEKSNVSEKKNEDAKIKFVDKKISEDKELEEAIVTPKATKKEKNKSEIMEDKKQSKEKNKGVYEKTVNKVNASDDGIKKLTRSSKKCEVMSKVSVEVPSHKTRRVKKVIIESDSDSDLEEVKQVDNDQPKIGETNENMDIFNSSFGIYDLGIFPGNSEVVDVVANINDLIADLDKELENKSSEGNNQFTQELSLDNMLQNINSPEAENSKEESVEESLQDISELINNDLKDADAKPSSFNEKKVEPSSDEGSKLTPSSPTVLPIKTCTNIEEQKINETLVPKTKISTTPKLIKDSEVSNKVEEDSSSDSNKVMNESTVSTTNKIVKQKIYQFEETDDLSSTPDSTINTSEVVKHKSCEESLPDSTNELHTENSDITSTHDAGSKDTLGPNSLNNDSTSEIGSISNLLSILQNKSKINELLCMLGGKSSDNDKIMKKLEKLKELVSDEEDTNDDVDKNEREEEPNPKELPVVDNIKELQDGPVLPIDSSEVQLETHEKEMETTNEVPVHDEPASDDKHREEHVNTTPQKVVKGKSGRKARKSKLKAEKKIISNKAKRITRSGTVLNTGKPKASRELRQLQNDIKEMFINDDILNATGIRMCRLAKLVDEKQGNQDGNNTVAIEPKPVVVLQKFKEIELLDDKALKIKKRPGPKPKPKVTTNENHSDVESKTEIIKTPPKRRKPGPKSKTKLSQDESDPYAFESDSVSDITTSQPSEEMQNSSESESESLASSKSFESTEALADLKKKKRKRRSGWSSGVIAKRKKKIESKQKETLECELLPEMLLQKKVSYPDMSCFVDRTYCFYKNISIYPCRLCEYSGSDIVHHYKKQHSHSEVPLSRINATVAREAIEQCEDIDFNAMSRLPSEKFICRFCFKEIYSKRALLETFFWHVASMHTGEYKQLCPQCVNVVPCPYKMDIPPPPKDSKGQLIGYICGKCNFTQISLENLKIHVIVRHNDERTEVYTINLAIMTKKNLGALMKRQSIISEPRLLRSHRNLSATETSGDRSDDYSELTDISYQTTESKKDSDVQDILTPKIPVHSKLTFESDDTPNLPSENIKVEKEDNQEEMFDDAHGAAFDDQAPVSDILDYPHFKIGFKGAGAKEYICCINGNDNHYKTSLLISMKKHVQTKHSENWDGYCFVCKVIVMPQGKHSFRDCLQHMLDKHIDSFPVLANTETTIDTANDAPEEAQIKTSCSTEKPTIEEPISSKSYIVVRPLSDLMSKENEIPTAESGSDALPKIQSVISLGAHCVEPSISSPTPPAEKAVQEVVAPSMHQELVRYEEAQAEIMSKKHRIVLDAMLVPEKLIQIFKCAGRFCSFTTDSAEAALVHASTHQRIGGENALMCAYCNSDSKGNGIDLITHVFKNHGYCHYTCGYCFYRAAASQLVRAHMIRVHGTQHAQSIVYQNSVTVPTNEDKTDILPRNLAVQYYVCAVAGCKFKTFTQGKFSEHLMKHEPPHSCHICSSSFSSPVEVIQHLKTHGLMLYQCTWCVYGAENEGELLQHASAEHPSKIPQAYLRIITQKDGNASKMMVLPLAQLNKSIVQVKVLTAGNKTDDPSREAERSMDLEKLIGSVILPTMDTTATLTVISDNDPNIECTPSLETSSGIMDKIPHEPTLTDDSEMATLIPEPPRTPVPPTVVPAEELNLSKFIPVLKTEPLDEIPTKDNPSSADVICLDSDEENSRDTAQNIISLSDDDTATSTENLKPEEFEKFSASDLYKCSGCSIVYKSPQAFKRHVTSTCLSKMDKFNCAHCVKIANDLDELLKHYTHDHGACPKLRRQKTQINTKEQRVQNYVCGICDHKGSSLFFIKSHLKNYHGVTNVIVASKHLDNGGFLYTVREAPGSKSKRKLSAGSASEQTPPKRKRYSPQDLNQLPTRPIFDEPALCSECEFSTKVLSNLVRHLQQHADAQAVPSTVPVNPVPHLETNEKHFDKMINLASSSLVNKNDKPSRTDKAPSVTLLIPPEAATRFPKYVPDRRRHTCGAQDCSYISVDEAMLKCHWETLHAGSTNYRCVHCPHYQQLDTSKPLTAPRIIAHLKMHDVRLYACSSCTYYHYKRELLDKHLAEIHKGSGQVMIVREEAKTQDPAGAVQPPPATPTMDLKPWQCGLCKYKNLLRQEVIEHCSKVHNSKWQYKCPNCPFRGSTLENVSNHQSRVHPESHDDVFYYYYREGSLPEDADGIPRWQKQRQKVNYECEVKTESQTGTEASVPATTPPTPVLKCFVTAPKSVTVDLNLVKKEVVDTESEESIEQLYKRFGSLCNPNGLKYKCPLCKIVMEVSKEAMQSHLYEELQYRKWGCSICMYKAFHKTGLNEHMFIEHSFRQVTRHEEGIELPTNVNIEKWVTKVLDHQTHLIAKNKENLDKQKIQTPKPDTMSTTMSTPPFKTSDTSDNVNVGAKEFGNLSQAFGKFGAPRNINFCCPKCDLQTRDENVMKNHLELELNKIRWRCSSCSDYSQNYHEAQLHCKTCKNLHPGQSARPIEALRDPSMRAAWVSAVINTQKQTMKQLENMSTSSDDQSNLFDTIDNSLLAVRYEEKVPTPEEEMLQRKKGAHSAFTAAATTSPDSDDERLVIDEVKVDEAETPPKKKPNGKKCKYCDYTTKYNQAMYTHTLRHYNLMPCYCTICGFSCHKASMVNHFMNYHPGEPEKYIKTPIPSGPPLIINLENKRYRRSLSDDYTFHKKNKERGESVPKKEEAKPNEEAPKTICLVCEKVVPESEKTSHFHDKLPVTYARKGEVVVKCCICLALLSDDNAMQEHHTVNHPDESINYAYFKLNYDTREIIYCGHCKKGFKFMRDLRTHHNTLHCSLSFKYESKPYTPGSYDYLDIGQEGPSCVKRTNDISIQPLPKRVAKKSTTKLPYRTVARKSTTKLPFIAFDESDLEQEEFSYFGTKPTPIEQLDKVNLLMSFSNTMMPMSMTLKKLSEIMNIDPKVIVKDCKK